MAVSIARIVSVRKVLEIEWSSIPPSAPPSRRLGHGVSEAACCSAANHGPRSEAEWGSKDADQARFFDRSASFDSISQKARNSAQDAVVAYYKGFRTQTRIKPSKSVETLVVPHIEALPTDGLAKRASEKSLSRPVGPRTNTFKWRGIQVACAKSSTRRRSRPRVARTSRLRWWRGTQSVIFHATLQALVGAARAFHFQQEAEPIFERETRHTGSSAAALRVRRDSRSSLKRSVDPGEVAVAWCDAPQW